MTDDSYINNNDTSTGNHTIAAAPPKDHQQQQEQHKGPKDLKGERVCVVGATGHLGLAVARELRNRGATVTAVARNPRSSNVQILQELGARVEFVDASNEQETYADAVESCTAAVSCMAASPSAADSLNDFWAIDRDANIRFGLEALRAGVKHLILVSTFEGRDSRAVSAFSNAKEEAVDVLRSECERNGATFSVVRPNAYFKDLTDYAFDRVLSQGVHKTLGDGSHKINPISREDAASYIANLIQEKQGGEFPLGGPDVFTFREIGVLAAQTVGKDGDLQFQVIPVWSLRAAASALDLLGFVSRFAHRRAAFLHWMVYCSTHNAVAPSYGTRHLHDEYRRKFDVYKSKLDGEK
jgi:divinyl chlorophyllide a 8-vinyl-reductase